MSTDRTAKTKLSLTSRDLEILKWIARCRFVTYQQVQARFELQRSKVFQRLQVLKEAGLIKSERVLHRKAAVHIATRSGLQLLESELPIASIGLQSFLHDQAVVWEQVHLELSGCETRTEREMRAAEKLHGESYAVRIPPSVNAGAQSHMPDLAFQMKDQWFAVEVELSPKSEARLASILSGYLAEARYNTVLYCVPTSQLITRVTKIGTKLGMGDRLKVVAVQQPAAA